MVGNEREVFILGASADIGKSLIDEFRNNGFRTGGTYRSLSFKDEQCYSADRKRFIHCDFANPKSISEMVGVYQNSGLRWDIIVSSVGTMEPVGKFFEIDFDQWEKAIQVNMLSQLRALHGLYRYRKVGEKNHIVFFAGGGTNSPFRNYSAYCTSKIALIKMCELLDDEYPDLNVFIVGPGWVRTKIHEQTLRNADKAGDNYGKTLEFMKSGQMGTDIKQIYNCIAWGIEQGREVVGGRNFSVVHDKWGQESLRRSLAEDANLFKLRRYSQLSEET